MLVLAIGTFTDPSKIGPYAEAETATIHAHKAAGIVAQAYQRVDGKGVALVWRVGEPRRSTRADRAATVLAARADDGGAHGDRGVLKTAPVQPLLRPYRLRDLELPNRVVMAPLTRMRATNPERAPTALHAEYYAQRATAGLIISEGTFVSPASVGWARVPGLWSAAQVAGWRLVTEAVHRAGGRIFVQLWHTGSLSHPDFYDGDLPPAPSRSTPVRRASRRRARRTPWSRGR